MSTEEARMDPANNPTSEPQMESNPGPSGTTGSGSKPSEPNLADELREFGKQIESIFTTVRNSSRGKEIEQQLTSAWRDMERGVNGKITSAQATDLKGTVTGTAQYAADEVQTGLAKGLRNLNQWMSTKNREMDERLKKREEAVNKAAASGTADDDIADRFGNQEPVFGAGETVPAVPVHVTMEPNAANNPDTAVTDRFDDKPPSV